MIIVCEPLNDLDEAIGEQPGDNEPDIEQPDDDFADAEQFDDNELMDLDIERLLDENDDEDNKPPVIERPVDPPFVPKPYREIVQILRLKGINIGEETVRNAEVSALAKIRTCFEASRFAEAMRLVAATPPAIAA